MVESDGIVREFLLESFESLEQADTDLVALESSLATAAFSTASSVSSTPSRAPAASSASPSSSTSPIAGESVLSRLRSGELPYTPEVANLLLELADSVRRLLAAIDATGAEGEADYGALVDRLNRLKEGQRAGQKEPQSAAEREAQPAGQDEQRPRRGRRPALSPAVAPEAPATAPPAADARPP